MLSTMQKVSCIIPVYNEGPRIKNVLSIVAGHPLIHEVLVVDDGSTDETTTMVREFARVQLILHSTNKGKTQAIMTGVAKATGELLLLLDGDLVGLTPHDLTRVINPVLVGDADTSISLRKNSPWIDRVIGVDIFSGERVFPQTLIQGHVPEILCLPRFGFESYLNTLIIQNNYRIKIVPWNTVVSPWKYQKKGFVRGIIADFFMIVDILRTISVFQVLYQFKKLRSLRVT